MIDFSNLKLPDSIILSQKHIVSDDKTAGAIEIDILSTPTENSYILSRVWLPDNWSGILLSYGNGGIAGVLASSCWPEIKEGYAVAITDMGTSRVRSGEMKSATLELYKDFAWRSTHIMTLCAKELCKAKYGRLPIYSYFYGASAGGLQALSEVQRFPEDYDGVVAGVPSNNTLNLIFYFYFLYRILHRDDGVSYFTSEICEEISASTATPLCKI